MALTKHLAIKLMEYYDVDSFDELLRLVPNDCPKCYSTDLDFYGYNRTEAVWKCLKCKHLTSVPYNIDKTLFFFKN